ncbi:MAG: S41 family peptidase [Kiritimatiellae bacterium]|nr:S41 family peptidase [Kiritimatiellia bacterium]
MARCRPRRAWSVLAGALYGAIAGAAPAPRPEVAAQDEAYAGIAKFAEVLLQVRRHYVDTNRTSYAELINGAMRGLIASLDEYSEFMDSAEYRAMQEDTEGEFGGVGLVVGMREGALVVISPIDGTPGAKAGLRSGDRLVEINGRPTSEMDLGEAVRLMRGPPGTTVRIKVLKPGRPEPVELVLQRAKIEVDSVESVRVLGDGIGYVRITQFDARTAEMLDRALARLEREGARALILDVRNNPGGLLESAVEVCSRFLPRGRMVLITQGRDERQRQTFLTRAAPKVYEWPIAVLLNEGSASAAEVVAGCLQDHRRAVLIGERSFGKGSVQSLLPLSDGSALRLTTARYYTPNRRMIHELGIEPDVLVPWAEQELGRANDAPMSPSSDPQLLKAADMLRGVLKYGQPATGPGRAG